MTRHGYDDWAGEIDGYGDSLEIRVFGVRLNDPNAVPENRTRSAAKQHLPPVALNANPLERDERVRALLNFAESFRS